MGLRMVWHSWKCGGGGWEGKGEGDVELAPRHHHLLLLRGNVNVVVGFDTNVVGGRRGGDEAPGWGMPVHQATAKDVLQCPG